MSISRRHRDTYLLALGLSIDSALRNNESTSKGAAKLRTCALSSNKRAVVRVSPADVIDAFQNLPSSESANASCGFHTIHAQSGLPAA